MSTSGRYAQGRVEAVNGNQAMQQFLNSWRLVLVFELEMNSCGRTVWYTACECTITGKLRITCPLPTLRPADIMIHFFPCPYQALIEPQIHDVVSL
jgi:hypothetical protein